MYKKITSNMTDPVDNNNQIAIFMEISGMNYDMAKETLIMYNYNLEQAINFHLEGEAEDSEASNQYLAPTSTTLPTLDDIKPRVRKDNKRSEHLSNELAASTSTTTDDMEDDFVSSMHIENEVRAPIPPKREQMIMPEEDNFRFRKRRIVPFRTVCPLRNFELEGRLQEEQMEAAALSNLSEGSDGLDNNFASMPGGHPSTLGLSSSTISSISKNSFKPKTIGSLIPAQPKRSRLSDLYRPPVDISFSGPLQAVRDYSEQTNRWLIVNVQNNTDFKCQVMNRDIWSNAKLREIMKKYFVFWQVANDNSEGLRFQAFYTITDFPYVGIIDPITGEEKLHYKNGFNLTANEFIQELRNYLKTNTPYPNPDAADGNTDLCEMDFSDLAISDDYSNDSNDQSVLQSPDKSLPSPIKNKKRRLVIEPSSLSEQEQIELAIGRSLQEIAANSNNSTKTKNSDNSDGEDDEDNEDDEDDDDNENEDDAEDADCEDDDDEDDVNAFDDSSYEGNVTQSNEKVTFKTPANQDMPMLESTKEATEEQVINSTNSSYDNYLGSQNDPKTRIQLRLPSGERHILEWPCSSKLKALKLFIPQQFPELADEAYKIICPFSAVPKQSADYRSNILDMNEMLTLEEAFLHSTVTLHLQNEE